MTRLLTRFLLNLFFSKAFYNNPVLHNCITIILLKDPKYYLQLHNLNKRLLLAPGPIQLTIEIKILFGVWYTSTFHDSYSRNAFRHTQGNLRTKIGQIKSNLNSNNKITSTPSAPFITGHAVEWDGTKTKHSDTVPIVTIP